MSHGLASERLSASEWAISSAVLETATVIGVVESVIVTSGATAGVPGAWSEVHAGVSATIDYLTVFCSTTALANASSSMLLDVGVGPAGAEVVVIQSIPIGFFPSALLVAPVAALPCSIPEGSRVAYRTRGESTRTSFSVNFSTVFGATAGMRTANPIEFGADTSTCAGVKISNPPTTYTKGAWTEVIDSTPVRLIGIHISPGMNGVASAVNSSCMVDIGVGSAGNETVTISDVPMSVWSSETISRPIMLVPCNIPSGVRVSARYSRTGTQRLDLVLHGVPA